jgi:hypothetical protein
MEDLKDHKMKSEKKLKYMQQERAFSILQFQTLTTKALFVSLGKNQVH